MLRTLGFQVLAFPTIVVALASTTFFFGGTCALWQWYLGLGLTLTLPIVWLHAVRPVARAALCLLGILALMRIGQVFAIDWAGSSDLAVCHIPLIRMLTEGWNPVTDPTGEAFCVGRGLWIWDMYYYHAVFSPRAYAVFNAVAYHFSRDPFAVTYPVIHFLMLAFILKAIDEFRHLHWSVGLVFALVTAFGIGFYLRMPADAAVTFSSGGMLLSLFGSLRRRTVDWCGFSLFGVWLLNVKFAGTIFFLAVLCLILLVVLVRRSEWKPHSAALVLGTLALVFAGTALFSFSPFVTSWRKFGHPLYPARTGDVQRYPERNPIWDFEPANDDARRMGHIGSFVNAYASPRLTRAYYNWSLGRTDFAPKRYVWDKRHGQKTAPLSFGERLALMLSLCVLLFSPRLRLMGLLHFVLLLSFPDELMGYLRYQPWVYTFESMALTAVALFLSGFLDRWRWRVWILAGCGLSVIIPLKMGLSWRHAFEKAKELNCDWTARTYVVPSYKNNPNMRLPPNVEACRGYYAQPEGSVIRRNNMKLLCLQMGVEDPDIRPDDRPWRELGPHYRGFGYGVEPLRGSYDAVGCRGSDKTKSGGER